MKTIKVKVIDLYNKIANSKDEDYKKIKFIFNDYTYTWNEYKCDYDSENTALKVNEIIELLNNSVLLSEKEVGKFIDKVNGK